MYFKYLIVFYLIFNSITCFAQRPVSDIIKTNNGDVVIQPIFHGTLVLQFNGKTIYIDPYGGAKAFEGITKPDLILITDIHGDHLNINTLNDLNLDNTINFIVPKAVADKLPEAYHKNIQVLNNGESTDIFGVFIKAIPMYNLPEADDAKHTKGRGNGYVLTIGGKKIYISGDTEDIPEMRDLQNIDVAFVVMNLPYTMNIEQAASAVLEFQPKIVYPFHYRGKPDMSDTEAFKKLVNTQNSDIEVRLRNWYVDYE
jgi:L-ascorbate metabolism protein UlaG (beta-lactamase superfamily)